jgi:ParB-like nuclease domain
LIPYAKNARTHTDAQIAAIAASIKEWGWTSPALVGEDGGLIAGHARVLAARQLGIAEIPVMVAAGWTEAQKRAYVLPAPSAGRSASRATGWRPPRATRCSSSGQLGGERWPQSGHPCACVRVTMTLCPPSFAVRRQRSPRPEPARQADRRYRHGRGRGQARFAPRGCWQGPGRSIARSARRVERRSSAGREEGLQISGVPAKVNRSGVPVRIRETITIGAKTTSMRGRRYLTLRELERQVAAGLLTVLNEEHDRQGNLKKVEIEAVRYVESDTALVNRILGREVGGKQNILVINDEAHHAYRIQRAVDDGEDEGEEDEDYFVREATVWVDGLDRINKLRGINFCIDLSATPYFIGQAGLATNTIFPWVVTDFGLTDAIESGLVKIPQLAVRDTTGREVPGYFNIWHWIFERLTPAERGGKRSNPKPEAILKYANMPIVMLGGLWNEMRKEWAERDDENRPPVFILVCKNTRIARVIYEWLAENKPPIGIPPARIEELRNTKDRVVTIRVDSKVVQESDTDGAKSDEVAWMRFTLDTVGRSNWPFDTQQRPIYPDGFAELAEKLQRPLHPPGRDVRCIVSVGMLTEGWDCNTVTHIIGLRPMPTLPLRRACARPRARCCRKSETVAG